MYPAENSVASFPFTDNCRLLHEEPAPVCTFGASAARATRHIALIGDSHALQWRSALDIAARGARWRGYSLTTAACAFSAATEQDAGGLSRGVRSVVPRRRPLVPRGIRRSAPCSSPSTRRRRSSRRAGQTLGAVKIAGYRRTWRALPKTVKHVVVIHDTPTTTEASS